MAWDNFQNWEWVPFLLGTAGTQPRWNTARFLEAVLIAGGTMLGTMYIQSQLLEAEIVRLNASIQELKVEIRQIRTDLYSPKVGSNELQRDLRSGS